MKRSNTRLGASSALWSTRTPGLTLALGLTLTLGACTAEEGDTTEMSMPMEGGEAVTLFDNLGTYSRTASTDSEEAKAFFDQGLRLQYAFNHFEAVRAYEEALRHDPDCALCWWGIALASGPNINAPMTDEEGTRAYEAARRAAELVDDVTPPVERALIEAVGTRYAEDPTTPRPALDSLYRDAMAEVAEAYPNDPDVRTLFGAAAMNLSPWNYWSGTYGNRVANPGTEEILATLEAGLALDSNHPGACHYYIHAVEAAYPDRAVECADRLAALMPGAGHIVHMPGHIYIRVGRYADAVRANEHAVHSDETYLQDLGAPSLYAGAYYPHNYHFMAFAASMAGMSEAALNAAREVAPKVAIEVALEVPWIQNAVVLPHLTMVNFGDWEGVLAEPMPPEELFQSTLMALYAKGTAHAALGQTAEAEEILARVREMTAGIEDEPAANPVPHIAPHALAGEIALRSGDPENAVVQFRAAVDIEDALLYEEPPLWYYPLRHSLGQALMAADDPSGAEAAYREDLLRFPANGWSLFGLATALVAQGRTEEAAAVRREFDSAWSEADVTLTGSRF